MLYKYIRRREVVAVGQSRVYVREPSHYLASKGIEYEIIGMPVPMGTAEPIYEGANFVKGERIRPIGCSPDYGNGDTGYYTAQHCIDIRGERDTVKMSDGSEALIITKNPFKRFGFFCALCSIVRRTLCCVNRDWAIVSIGNTGEVPVAVLSGGTVPPGWVFFAPLVDDPTTLVGKTVTGVSRDYDSKEDVVGQWDIVDYGVVKYVIDGGIYVVEALIARGYSKPGYSGTNVYIAEKR
jgi:hypothetical protein